MTDNNLSEFMNFAIIFVKLIGIFLFLFIQRIACHIQVFALSRWLAVTLPVEYDEFTRGLQWSIPYLSLPWETGHSQPAILGSHSPDNPISSMYEVHDSGNFQNVKRKEEVLGRDASVYGLPLSPMEYRSYFEVRNCTFPHYSI